ncbi:MAG: hypothetical protein ABL983_01135 [Nitrospira sp.]
MRHKRLTLSSSILALTLSSCPTVWGIESFCPGGSNPTSSIIWCDDFEDSVPLSQKYFDYDDNGGDFIPLPGVGYKASTGVQVKWQKDEVNAGSLKRTFGRNPVFSQSHSTVDFQEIYWRLYIRQQVGWTGSAHKLSRVTTMASHNWAQGMIGQVWGNGASTLDLDPATGIDTNGNLATSSYNDFNNIRWLGSVRGLTPLFEDGSGKWYCIEVHAKLNRFGQSDGIFELWIDNSLEARRADLDWHSTWQQYGINAVFFENYWNGGAPDERTRYFDNIVISTARIGCIQSD